MRGHVRLLYLRGEIGIESCAPLKAAVIYEQEEEIEKNVERKKKKIPDNKLHIQLPFLFLFLFLFFISFKNLIIRLKNLNLKHFS